MSSHREAPGVSKDQAADNTDVYAFVSPDAPDTVTLIANYIPLQEPDGGPNFYEFADDVLYEIHVSNAGTAESDITYQFRFTIEIGDPKSFLYNTGPITSLSDTTWNRKQKYTVTKIVNGKTTKLGSGLACPPCNVGPGSTPNYSKLADAAIHTLSDGSKVFAGQRSEGFYVDLGAAFDLLDLRPFQSLHISPMPDGHGVNGTTNLNVHSIAIQVPKTHLTKDGSSPSDVMSPKSVIGVWASASRQMSRMYDSNGTIVNSGKFVQVSRLGQPLINEVIIPMGKKDLWNSSQPSGDKQFAAYYEHPEVSTLLPALYPGVFPHLKKLKKARADLLAVLLTGLPAGIVPKFQNNTGKVMADMLRLNMAVPPTAKPNPAGLVAGDAAGYPNGRRVVDDVVTVELRALAGLTYALVDKSYKPDAAVGKLTDGVSNTNMPYLPNFPYLGEPISGFSIGVGTTAAGAKAGGGQVSAVPSGGAQTGGGGTANGNDSKPYVEAGAAALAAAAAIGVGTQLLKEQQPANPAGR